MKHKRSIEEIEAMAKKLGLQKPEQTQTTYNFIAQVGNQTTVLSPVGFASKESEKDYIENLEKGLGD